jgi:hypothetical protein
MSAYRPSRRCKLSDADTLTIYLDEKRTKPLRRFTGTSLSQFHPVVIASNRFWLQFQVTTPPLLSLSLSPCSNRGVYLPCRAQRQSGMPNNEPQWGYLMNVTPTNELLNLALWISEFLAEEADPARYDLTQSLLEERGKLIDMDLFSTHQEPQADQLRS